MGQIQLSLIWEAWEKVRPGSTAIILEDTGLGWPQRTDVVLVIIVGLTIHPNVQQTVESPLRYGIAILKTLISLPPSVPLKCFDRSLCIQHG